MKKRYKNKVYIAGKISGLDYNDVKVTFASYKSMLEARGYVCINPTEVCFPTWSWLKCMVICVFYLLHCNYIYLIPGWENSKGAKIEYKITKFTNIKRLEL